MHAQVPFRVKFVSLMQIYLSRSRNWSVMYYFEENVKKIALLPSLCRYYENVGCERRMVTNRFCFSVL